MSLPLFNMINLLLVVADPQMAFKYPSTSIYMTPIEPTSWKVPLTSPALGAGALRSSALCSYCFGTPKLNT